MCGRFVVELSPNLVQKVFGLAEIPDLPPRYNVAPTQPIPVIREASDGSRRLSMMRWGLVPSWSKEIGEGLINARSETVNEKPSFRQALRQRRCIIPASGFYEWLRLEGKKVPYYIRMADGAPMLPWWATTPMAAWTPAFPGMAPLQDDRPTDMEEA